MAKTIAIFNHKGGVSKTTSTFNLGWILADKGKRVIIVDADPQCNLTGLVLGYTKTELEDFYRQPGINNLRDGLSPAYESKPELIKPVDCIEVPGRTGLYLLPGHINLAEYEVTLGIAQNLSGSIITVRNLPGAANYLFEKTAEAYSADYVIIDMGPSVSSMNQNLLITSDYFIVPTSPDYFSVMAIDSLKSVLPKWAYWSDEAQKSDVLTTATYPFPNKKPKFLGLIIQKYRLRDGGAAQGFQNWIDRVKQSTARDLIPVLRNSGMALDKNLYDQTLGQDDYCLSQIPDFNSLITYSQDEQTPVFALTKTDLGTRGRIYEKQSEDVERFREIFDDLANKVISLTQ
jgi:cellulose biosynthesis protein BcsQ